jgi:hypothetical protein
MRNIDGQGVQDFFGTALCTTSMALMSSSAMRNIDGRDVRDIFAVVLWTR